MKILMLLLTTVGLSGCSLENLQNIDASAESKPFEEKEAPIYFAQSYENGRLKLPKVSMFLWKVGVTAADVEFVSRKAKEWSEYDQIGADLSAVLTPQIEAAELRFDELATQKRNLKKEMDKAAKSITARESQLENLKTKHQQIKESREKTFEELNQEKLKETPDQVKIDELSKQLASFDAQISQLELDMQNSQSEILLEKEKLVKSNESMIILTAEVTQAETELKTLQTKLNHELQENSDKGSAALELLQARTDWLTKNSPEIVLNFKKVLANGAETYPLVIKKWDPLDGGGERTFTSFPKGIEVSGFAPEVDDTKMDWNSIEKVEYQESGAKISFLVRAAHGRTFIIKFARSDFKDSFKRMNFGGDIIIKQEGEPDRLGVIKLSDKKN